MATPNIQEEPPDDMEHPEDAPTSGEVRPDRFVGGEEEGEAWLKAFEAAEPEGDTGDTEVTFEIIAKGDKFS